MLKKPNANIVEKIKEKFSTPQEFVTQYNAFLMSRLKDKSLEEWFNDMPEDELDTANEYYLQNERISKFTNDLKAIKRKCKTKSQRAAFNELLRVFKEEC